MKPDVVKGEKKIQQPPLPSVFFCFAFCPRVVWQYNASEVDLNCEHLPSNLRWSLLDDVNFCCHLVARVSRHETEFTK